MKTMKCCILISCLLLVTANLRAQDPAFSQFFSSPLNINPALTANINSDWRLITNLRDQWIGPASPYVTGTVSFDTKVMQNKAPNMPENNFIGLGGMLMFDHAMSGVVKSSYGSLNLSYNVKLTEGYYTERLGIGFGAIYGHRRIDFSRIDFEEQFTGFGFNRNLPTGETALSNMKAYISASAGITYSATSEQSNFDIGISAFHLNKPRQTFLKDEQQVLAIRKVAHANYERYLNDQLVINANGIYQYQSKASYFSVGTALGYFLGDAAQTLLTAGLWYWS
ncbi:MAG TPA: PorP/SprF family type IX secretion system membrane protein, partial [Chitinophagaceae bacterium]|nr:PorP/SprF family type IX secretion system membrane protein [Chitinophagaceae bacterium]